MRAAAAAVMAVAAAVGIACAAPSRRLSPRVVDDPIVLPRRMASVAIGAYKNWYPLTHASPDGTSPLSVRIGLTNRLELYNLLGLRYALLDDAPGSPLPPSRLSLAVQAGAQGVGYSSAEGWIVYPILGIRVQKHLAERWRFSLSADWNGFWYQKPVVTSQGYDAEVRPFA